MIFYWFLFLIPAWFALRYAKPRHPQSQTVILSPLWFLGVGGLALIIGMRHQVGGDWTAYTNYVEVTRWWTLDEVIFTSDPGYALLNWFGAHLGGGVYLVNTICGVLFCLGLAAFCRDLPRPWLALAIAVPYLVLVVAMGYSRQGVAIGIAMGALVLLKRGKLWRFVMTITLASLFHKSAVILILVSLGLRADRPFLTLIGLIGSFVGLYLLLLHEAVEALRVGYLEAEYHSSGAAVRVAMNALPGMIFLGLKKRFALTDEDRRLWTRLAWLSLLFVGLLLASPSLTAVDRVALYLIPLQLFVWSHFPDAIGRTGQKNSLAVLLVLGLYASVLFVWLFFADHRHSWIPYKFFPLELL